MKEYVVNTTSGKVKGYLRNNLVEYLGIPFAQPPVGSLRFKRAQPVAPWQGIYDAGDYGKEAVQLDEGQLKGSEDCLTLNIRRPMEGKDLPVLVWIHGGGYNTGSASVPLYSGVSFAEKGIVFVSVQYRLNVLGFYDFTTYPGCEDFESNCGVSDQILAITWIHENIKAFGGDPGRITIAGESAGGASVVNMLAAPAVKGMFSQAIAQSPLPNCIATHRTAGENIDLFLEGMGWNVGDLQKLRTINPFELQKGNTYVAEKHQYKNPGIFLPGPIQDDLLPVRPIDAIRSGSAEGVKLLIGTNKHEGTLFVHPEKTGFPNNWAMTAAMFEKNGHAAALPEMIRYYQPSPEEQKLKEVSDRQREVPAEQLKPFINFATDYAFRMPSLKAAQAQKAYGDVWLYSFEFVSKSGKSTGMGASHAYELPCMFADKEFAFSRFIFDGETEETADTLIEAMHSSWVRFIKTGEPDKENWPKYTGYHTPVRVFDRVSRTEIRDFSKLMELWKDMRFYEN